MIKKIFIVFSLVLLPVFAFAETIKNYAVDITLQKDGSLLVIEDIKYDFNLKDEHGIYRDIPLRFDVEGQEAPRFWQGSRALDIDIISVERNGVEEVYSVKNNANGVYKIKIGSEGELISGVHDYQISYKVDGSLRYFDSYDEIYWNAIGSGWSVPIEKAAVVVDMGGVEERDSICYQGEAGSGEVCKILKVQGLLFAESERRLGLGEGLTVAISFDKGLVEVREDYAFNYGLLGIGIPLSLLWAFGGTFILGRRFRNKHNPRGPVIAEYGSYKGYGAAYSGYLIDGSLSSRDIAAGILQLAQRGYIRIERIPAERGLFGKKEDFSFIFIDESELRGEVDKMDEYLLDFLFEKGSDGFSGERVLLSEMKKYEAGRGVAKRAMAKYVEKAAKEAGYVERFNTGKKVVGYFVLMFLLVFALLLAVFFLGLNPVYMLFPIFGVILLVPFLISTAGIRKTREGFELERYLKGFRLFMKTAEKSRMDFFNDPKKDGETFMKNLPYAMAFGVEEKWSELFEGMELESPEWYSSSEPFSASAFGGSLASISSAVSSGSTRPSSSGSGGGGFSGGGAGGGGGGSW